MTKQQFNIAIAEKVMGWETVVDRAFGSYDFKQDGMWSQGWDFYYDHNAAALVRARVAELGHDDRTAFVGKLCALVGVKHIPGWKIANYTGILELLNATPAQTARAAYVAVTGEELEACDE